MTEAQHQIDFVKWLHYHYPHILFWHTPNGELRDSATAAKLKKMGVTPGVPDLFLPQYHCFIEFKNTKGRLSESQRQIKKKLKSYGYTWITAYGFLNGVEKFKKFVNKTTTNKFDSY